MVDWVVSSNYDLGFASSTFLDIANVQNTPFATLPGVCILPPGHRLSAKETIEPVDLEGEDFLSYDPLDPNRMMIDQVFRDADVRRRILVEAPYAAVIAAMVSQGVGVAIVSPLATMDQQPPGLVVKPFTPTVPFGFSVLYRKDIPLSIAARAFLALMRTEIERTFGPEAMLAPHVPGPSGQPRS